MRLLVAIWGEMIAGTGNVGETKLAPARSPEVADTVEAAKARTAARVAAATVVVVTAVMGTVVVVTAAMVNTAEETTDPATTGLRMITPVTAVMTGVVARAMVVLMIGIRRGAPVAAGLSLAMVKPGASRAKAIVIMLRTLVVMTVAVATTVAVMTVAVRVGGTTLVLNAVHITGMIGVGAMDVKIEAHDRGAKAAEATLVRVAARATRATPASNAMSAPIVMMPARTVGRVNMRGRYRAVIHGRRRRTDLVTRGLMRMRSSAILTVASGLGCARSARTVLSA